MAGRPPPVRGQPTMEEVAYQARPPLLEDASMRGPLRIPVPGSMDTLEERESIESDFTWYRYSKFAAPFLLFILALAVALFALTAWQQVGGLKRFSAQRVGTAGREGIPHIIVSRVETEADVEAGLPKELRDVRIACVFIGIFGILFIFAVLLCKPRPKARMGMNLCLCLFLIATAVLAFISFGWGIDRVGDAVRCPYNYLQTYEKCESREGFATVAIILSGAIGMGSLVSILLLVQYTLAGDWRLLRTGWRERERDMEQEQKAQRDPKHNSKYFIRETRITTLTIALLFTLACLIVLTVFIVLLHEDRNTERRREAFWGGTRGRDLNRVSGWPDRNTRLRYALTGITILTILLNLIPFIHRIIAYFFAIMYFVAAVLCFVNFGFDIHEMQEADDLYPCPPQFRCIKAPFIATAIVEFLLGCSLLIYVLYEICTKCCIHSKHGPRELTPHEKSKHDNNLSSLRLVRDAVTGRPMTAKEYVYRWRHVAGTEYVPPPPQYPAPPQQFYPAEGFAPAGPGLMAPTMAPPLLM